MRASTLVNMVNLTTPVGLAVATVAGCRLRERQGCWEATGYRWRFPIAGAFTVGSVVISREPLSLAVWQHEMSHVRQYAWLGPLFWPAYGMAAAWSYLGRGDWWSANIFEQKADLRAGGYVRRPVRRALRRRRDGSGVGAAAD